MVQCSVFLVKLHYTLMQNPLLIHFTGYWPPKKKILITARNTENSFILTKRSQNIEKRVVEGEGRWVDGGVSSTTLLIFYIITFKLSHIFPEIHKQLFPGVFKIIFKNQYTKYIWLSQGSPCLSPFLVKFQAFDCSLTNIELKNSFRWNLWNLQKSFGKMPLEF